MNKEILSKVSQYEDMGIQSVENKPVYQSRISIAKAESMIVFNVNVDWQFLQDHWGIVDEIRTACDEAALKAVIQVMRQMEEPV